MHNQSATHMRFPYYPTTTPPALVTQSTGTAGRRTTSSSPRTPLEAAGRGSCALSCPAASAASHLGLPALSGGLRAVAAAAAVGGGGGVLPSAVLAAHGLGAEGGDWRHVRGVDDAEC